MDSVRLLDSYLNSFLPQTPVVHARLPQVSVYSYSFLFTLNKEANILQNH